MQSDIYPQTRLRGATTDLPARGDRRRGFAQEGVSSHRVDDSHSDLKGQVDDIGEPPSQ